MEAGVAATFRKLRQNYKLWINLCYIKKASGKKKKGCVCRGGTLCLKRHREGGGRSHLTPDGTGNSRVTKKMSATEK